MYKQVIQAILMFGVSLSLVAEPIPDGETLIKQIDQTRVTSDQVKVVTEITLIKNDQIESTKLFEVWVSTERRSLAVFKTAKEKGQKVLMLGDDFWMLMPKSKRPIRITPMQKLLGEASTGDIASLRWSEDYRVNSTESHQGSDCLNCWLLELESKRKGISYDRVELFVDKQSLVPKIANLYLKSGKLAKVAKFVMGEKLVEEMILVDGLQNNQVTKVKYLEIKDTDIPDKFFNPTYLQRNPDKI